ncbi:hypothetical protein [Streptomyces sp. NPDC058739]|uniref:hypothetical protein n=1 Tax=Streptomyces sp. NPDC058739 TaxID=3346618 RepID=UPI0036A30F81
MPSMTSPPALADRPPLPIRPTPHERDGRQPTDGGGRPHPRHDPQQNDPTMHDMLHRVAEQQIGPRGIGAIYTNVDGAFEVISVVRGPERAQALLRRQSAQWALVIKDVLRPDAEPFAVGSVWTTSDHLVREATAVRTARRAVTA